jgi:5-methyltetrahydropteroyltriglutamate--homocysteine methyltransferase
MQRRRDRILTTHVGSLVRPPALRELLVAKEHHQPYDEQTFAERLAQAVAEVVGQQAEAGVDIVSDGEFGKSTSWSRYITERISGFEHRPDPGTEGAVLLRTRERELFADFYDEYEKTQGFVGSVRGWVCNGPVQYTGQAFIQRDIDNFKAALEKVDVEAAFMPAVSPASILPDARNEHYPSDEALIFAIADAITQEYRAIIDAGFLLQVDDAYIPTMYETITVRGTPADYRRWAELRVEAINRALDGIPPERVRYHVCWGSWNAPHVGDVPLRQIVDLILRVNAHAYAIEAANPRHEHEWRVWQTVELPEGKVLIPGVISHATNVVEHPELVAERITRFAEVVGRERVMAGTDCGFAQGPLVARVHPSIQWAKLQALAEGARLASQALW